MTGDRAGYAGRLRQPGVDVVPDRVREARTAAGLSLQDVAAGFVTRAAIHLVESGRSRPSMALLHHIAARTGKPVEWFLAEGAPLPPPARSADPVERVREDITQLLLDLVDVQNALEMSVIEREAVEALRSHLRHFERMVEVIQGEFS